MSVHGRVWKTKKTKNILKDSTQENMGQGGSCAGDRECVTKQTQTEKQVDSEEEQAVSELLVSDKGRQDSERGVRGRPWGEAGKEGWGPHIPLKPGQETRGDFKVGKSWRAQCQIQRGLQSPSLERR